MEAQNGMVVAEVACNAKLTVALAHTITWGGRVHVRCCNRRPNSGTQPCRFALNVPTHTMYKGASSTSASTKVPIRPMSVDPPLGPGLGWYHPVNLPGASRSELLGSTCLTSHPRTPVPSALRPDVRTGCSCLGVAVAGINRLLNDASLAGKVGGARTADVEVCCGLQPRHASCSRHHNFNTVRQPAASG